MSAGWFFTGEAGTQQIKSKAGGWFWQTWKEMDDALLNEMLEKLTNSKQFPVHVEVIKEELLTRKPPVEIVSITVTGKL